MCDSTGLRQFEEEILDASPGARSSNRTCLNLNKLKINNMKEQNTPVLGDITSKLATLTKEEKADRKKNSKASKKTKKSLFLLYELFLQTLLINTTNSKETIAALTSFHNILRPVVKFMLEERFISAAPKKKKIRKPAKMSADMLVFLSGEKKEDNKKEGSSNELVFLDIIKFFKSLENFILKRGE